MAQHPRQQAVVAVICQDGRYLFVKRSGYVEHAKGYWCPVSGRMEGDETQEQTLVREAMEEVGLEILPGRRVETIPTDNGLFDLHFWTATVIRGEAEIQDNEATELRWVRPDEISLLQPVFERDIQIIRNLDVVRDFG